MNANFNPALSSTFIMSKKNQTGSQYLEDCFEPYVKKFVEKQFEVSISIPGYPADGYETFFQEDPNGPHMIRLLKDGKSTFIWQSSGSWLVRPWQEPLNRNNDNIVTLSNLCEAINFVEEDLLNNLSDEGYNFFDDVTEQKILQIYNTFKDVNDFSFKDWYNSFKCNLESELYFWTIAAEVFLSFCQNRNLCLESKKDVLHVIVCHSSESSESIISRLSFLSKEDAIELFNICSKQ